MNVTRALRLTFALLTLALFAGAASAQEWPIAQAYKCRWSKVTGGSTAYGESIVTFQNLSGNNYTKTGNLHTDYVGGGFLDQAVTLTWNYMINDNSFFLQVTNGPQCNLTTYSGEEAGQAAVRFDGVYLQSPGPGLSCTNGAFQVCARHNYIVP